MKKILYLIFLFLFLLNSKSKSQNIGDFGSISNGSWTDTTIWRQWDGVGWNTIPTSFPSSSTINVYIRTGHTIIVPFPGPYNTGNLTVEAGAKLFTNNTTTNIYLSVWGTNINCNGEIGNGSVYDGIGFNIEGPTCNINGGGVFTACRIRKRTTLNATTTLTVSTNITLRWDQGSNTQFYNDIPSGAANFNLTINAGYTLNCEGSPGNPGNFSMDGVNGTSTASAGGQITVNGTLIIPGIMYATTNNIFSVPNYDFNLVIANGGILKVGQINSPASGTAIARVTVQNGGKLELIGLGFPAGTINWSTTNNRYDFAVGSTVEYSATINQNILTQSEFQSASPNNNQYYNLIVSGSGIKTIRPGIILTIRGNLTIVNNAILNQSTNNVDIQIGGNWINYNESAFQESNNKFVRFYGNFFPIQEIFCPNGEIFNNLIIAKSSSASVAIVKLLSPVTINNQLILGQTSSSVFFGILDLNKNSLTLNKSDSSAIRLQGPVSNSLNYRYIISEDTINRNTSIVNWKIDTATGKYIIPFGISNTKDTIPFYFIKSNNNNIGTLSVSTYGTPSSNLPYPANPISVTNLFGLNNPSPDNRDYTVDRFWYIGSSNQLNCDTVILTYNNRANSISELPVADPNIQNMKAQYWNTSANSWQFPFQYGVNSQSPYPSSSVTINNFNFSNTFWTLSSLNSPLPIELINFGALKEKNKIKVFWSTSSEINNDYFKLYKSTNAFNFDLIGLVKGKGNSNIINDYSFYDIDLKNELIYYKLIQVDYDGKEEEFPILTFKNNFINKKILKILNCLGQEIDEEYKGIKIYYYEDGSIIKRYE